MDETTRSVRAMYELYPYPAGGPKLRVASDVRMLLSYIARGRTETGTLRALDAGCGRGVGTLACATLQPDVQFVGIDINRTALSEATRQAKARKLDNVRFQEVDLMSLEGLEKPPGGFDVVYSSGVLHHLSDPAAGLRGLRAQLAPHGVMVVMVYGRLGREPLRRIIESIELVRREGDSYPERIRAGRRLAELMDGTVLASTPWAGTAGVDDTEFVDRCLNVQETSYDIASLWQMLEQADLRFLRWCEPGDWSLSAQFPGADFSSVPSGSVTEYRLIEQMCWRPSLELLVAHQDNAPRGPLLPAALEGERFAVSPDVRFVLQSRNLKGSNRLEGIGYKLRTADTVEEDDVGLVAALQLLRTQNQPFDGASFLMQMGHEGIDAQKARHVLAELVEREILYRPHPTEL